MRRQEFVEYVRKRRRQRLFVFAGSVLVIGIGVLVAWLANSRPSEQETTATATPSALVAATPEPVACGASMPKTAGAPKKSYPEPAEQKLDPDQTYLLSLETSCGDIEIELDVENSPKTTNSVAFLTREGFYDGLVFHRIVPEFVIQGGDPLGNGTGGAGYDVVEPLDEKLRYTKGIVAMAKGGDDPPGSSDSQFFIVSGDEGEDLPAEYALLGEVVSGMDVVEKIEKLGSEDGSPPSSWAYIERATIVDKE